MMRFQRIALFALVILWIVTGTLVAITYKLPGELDCAVCRPDTVAVDAFAHGTALTPPLMVFAVFCLLMFLSLRQGWSGTLGDVGVLLLSVVFWVAGVLDTGTHKILSGVNLLPLIILIWGIALLVVTDLVTVWDLWRHVRGQRRNTTTTSA